MRAGVATNLIFDMHSEYGSDATSEAGGFVKGLRKIFGPSVRIYTLDPESTRRGVQYDHDIRIGLNEIDVDDILHISDELNLTATAAESAYRLFGHYTSDWLRTLLDMTPAALDGFALKIGTQAGALSARKRKLEALRRRGYDEDASKSSVQTTLFDALMARQHVVLEFGKYEHSIDYMLVANIITRKIHQRWRERTETYLTSKNHADKPPHLS